MLQRLLSEREGRRYPETFRCMLLGGGPAPLPLLEQAKKSHIPVFQSYGMTETSSQIVTLSPEHALNKLGSAGKPLFPGQLDRKSTRLNSSHVAISYAVFCLKKKKSKN